MIQYSIRALTINRPQMSLFHESRKSTVEAISKQLKYFTKGHIAMQTMITILNLKWFYSLVPFSSLVL